MIFRLGVQRVYKTTFGRVRTQNPCGVLVYPDSVSVYLFGYAHRLGGAYYIRRRIVAMRRSVYSLL